MGVLRNIRHEKFAREYVKTGCGAEAYRRVYPRAHPISTARFNASRLQTYANVSKRIRELQTAMLKRSDITLEKLLTDLETAKEMAHRLEKPNDMTNATMAQGKLVGLDRTLIEQGKPGDFDNDSPISEVLEAVEQELGPEIALALAKKHNLTTEPEPKDDKLAQAIPPTDSVN